MQLETIEYFSAVRNFNYEKYCFQLDTRELFYAGRNYEIFFCS